MRPIPIMQGTIERRLLVNYRVDPGVLRRLVPPPFRPQLVHGVGVAGICMIASATCGQPGCPPGSDLRSRTQLIALPLSGTRPRVPTGASISRAATPPPASPPWWEVDSSPVSTTVPASRSARKQGAIK